jgi:hypothetical protein
MVGKKLYCLPNADKGFHEKWPDKKGYPDNLNLMNLVHPFQMLICARPNMGKSTLMKNLLLHQRPKFERCVIVHHDGDDTREYDDIGKKEIISNIPDKTFFNPKEKCLVMIDDIDMKRLNKEQRSNLYKLFSYVSTHKNVSVAAASQQPFDFPPEVRRVCNFVAMTAPTDFDACASFSKKVGLETEDLKYIFKNICTQKRDFFCIDMTEGSPAPFRKNMFEPLELITKDSYEENSD